MAVSSTLYIDGREGPTGPLRDLLPRVGAADVLLWVDVAEPAAGELTEVQTLLNLPSMAVEDAAEAHQRPKVDQYEDCVLIVAYGATMVDEEVTLHEVALFVGHGFVVTVRQAPAYRLDDLRRRLPHLPLPALTPTALAYRVLDRIVDDYFAVVEELQERIEDVDDAVWRSGATPDLNEAFTLRRDLVRLRRVVAPLREVLAAVERRRGGVLDDRVDERFRDLYDHVVTVHEELEMSRELLGGALEGYVSVNANRMNEVVLKVSGWAAIIAVPALIASIYGMNFDHMPELHWFFGYPFSLTLMGVVALVLYVAFRRRRWL